MSRLILASASPRRAELLRMAGIDFELHPVSIDESPRSEEDGVELVVRLAQGKAEACLQKHPEAVVLAADTVVLCRGEPRGKPRDYEDYAAMMEAFSDASHEVVSGVCVVSEGQQKVFHCVTTVVFGRLSSAWIKATGRVANQKIRREVTRYRVGREAGYEKFEAVTPTWSDCRCTRLVPHCRNSGSSRIRRDSQRSSSVSILLQYVSLPAARTSERAGNRVCAPNQSTRPHHP